MEKKFAKDLANKKIFGVCAGVAKYFNIDVTLVRIVWLILVICAGVGLLAYLIAALIMPNA